MERITQDELCTLLVQHEKWWRRKKNRSGKDPEKLVLKNKNLSGLVFPYIYCQKAMELIDCDLSNTVFDGCKLQFASFKGSNLTGAIFGDHCKLNKNNFKDCIFKNTIFKNVEYHEFGNSFRFSLTNKVMRRIKKEGFVPKKTILIVDDGSIDVKNHDFLCNIKSIFEEYMRYNTDIKILVLDDKNKSLAGRVIASRFGLKLETCNETCLEEIALPDKVILAGDMQNGELIRLTYKTLLANLEMRFLFTSRYKKWEVA